MPGSDVITVGSKPGLSNGCRLEGIGTSVRPYLRDSETLPTAFLVPPFSFSRSHENPWTVPILPVLCSQTLAQM